MLATIWNRLRRLHRFFLRHLLYPLILSSALAIALYLGRVYLSRQYTFFFLIWNLFLAWIPYLFSLWVASLHERAPRRWGWLLLPSFVWFIFLPNAPYILTDFWHLDERLPVPFWYDIGFITTFAWTGCFLAIASLRTMQEIVHDYFGRAASWFFVLAMIALSGVGIYLGRFMNWNSWDLILRPHSVLLGALGNFAHPVRNPQPFAVSALFAAFLLVAYLMFTSAQRQPAIEKE